MPEQPSPNSSENKSPEVQKPPEPKKYVVEDAELPGGRLEVTESQVADYLKTAVQAKRKLAQAEARSEQVQALNYIKEAAARNPAGVPVLDEVVSMMNTGLTPEQIRGRLAGRTGGQQADPTDDEAHDQAPNAPGGLSPEAEALRQEMRAHLQSIDQRFQSLQASTEKDSLLSEVKGLVREHPVFANNEVAAEIGVQQALSHLEKTKGEYAAKDVVSAVASRFDSMFSEQANADRSDRDRAANGAPLPTSSTSPGLTMPEDYKPPKWDEFRKRGSPARKEFKDRLKAMLDLPQQPGA